MDCSKTHTCRYIHTRMQGVTSILVTGQSQCLFFGLPKAELRRRYLAQYLRPYDSTAVDMDHLVHETEQTSQAFLKEYVLRAVQIAAEGAGYRPQTPLALTTEHFDVAFDELTGHGDPHGQAIMGFRQRR
jgi:hypothetical protein